MNPAAHSMFAAAQTPQPARLTVTDIRDDKAYFLRRIADCEDMAAKAATAASHHAHQQLAHLFRERLAVIEAEEETKQ